MWDKDKEKLCNAMSRVSIEGNAVDEIPDSSSAGNTLYENFGKAWLEFTGTPFHAAIK